MHHVEYVSNRGDATRAFFNQLGDFAMPTRPDIYTIDRAQLYALAAVLDANRNRRDALLLRVAGDYIYAVRPKRRDKKPLLRYFEATDEEFAQLSPGVPLPSRSTRRVKRRRTLA